MVGLNITPSDVAAHARGVLVVLSAAEESALKIERYLRNAGYPLRAAWICDLEDLSDALRGEGPDLVLCEADLATAPFKQVAQLCHQHQPD
ncbi:MAG TPA: hypothetical protein VFQ88_12915, partial [Nevskiaceae bacterium]|nr:hypothetical protein [Nevskiaceae bacterium]